jgi:hypothetical protein
MDLLLIRRWYTDRSTIGTLYLDNLFEMYTLEDIEREVKVPGKTAIPRGKYRIVLDWSNRFQKIMPHILDVPGFEGIRIHAGNTARDTEGCILVGLRREPDFVSDSKIAFNRLFMKMEIARKKNEPISIEIKREEKET